VDNHACILLSIKNTLGIQKKVFTESDRCSEAAAGQSQRTVSCLQDRLRTGGPKTGDSPFPRYSTTPVYYSEILPLLLLPITVTVVAQWAKAPGIHCYVAGSIPAVTPRYCTKKSEKCSLEHTQKKGEKKNTDYHGRSAYHYYYYYYQINTEDPPTTTTTTTAITEVLFAFRAKNFEKYHFEN
jgi:hypothetical protein